MKLTLKKKPQSSDREPLVVLVKEPAFFCQKVSVGQSIDVGDEMGYKIMSQYPGLFVVDGAGAEKSASGSYKNKSTTTKAKKSEISNEVAGSIDDEFDAASL